jgi:phosphate transport system substrate-binding protein
LASAAALSAGLAACGSSSSSGSGASTTSGSSGGGSAAVTLNGSGSTFAAPIYQQFGSDLKGQGITLNYQGVGSGDGVAQFTAGTVDFAGSDPALKDSEMAAIKKSKPVDIPIAFGAITASYNLPGVKTGLKLDGKTLADIFLTKVKTWNDPEIAKLNPGVKLPSTKITIVHRSDSSGTTKGFTSFLAAYSPQFKSQVGADKTVKWPAGTTGAKGNDGVAAAVKQTQGAVGYVEQAYALQNNFTFASVKNKAGKFIVPTLASTSAAGDGVKVPADLRFTVTDSPNPTAYPIASQTFVITYSDLCKGGLSKAKAQGMVRFLKYALGPGQAVVEKLAYAPLPAAIKTQAVAAVGALKCNGAPVGG